MFNSQIEDCAKRRLTERDELEAASAFLMSQGLDIDEVVVELARQYYVDVDALNEVLTELDNEILLATPQDSSARAA